MSGILKFLLGDETYLSWFNPGEDGNDGVKIYLHFKSNNITLRLKTGKSRYDVIQFIRNVHDNEGMKDQKEFKTQFFNLFHIEREMNKQDLIKQLKSFRVFKKDEVLFVNTGSKIEVIHNDENGEFITRINKNNKDSIDNIAIINNTESNPFIIETL